MAQIVGSRFAERWEEEVRINWLTEEGEHTKNGICIYSFQGKELWKVVTFTNKMDDDQRGRGIKLISRIWL